MSIHVMSKIMRDRTYDGKQKLILLAIADMVDQTGVGFASYRMIKEVTDVSDEYLRQSIAKFVADGRLQIVEKGTGRRHATVYRVLLPNSVAHNSVEGMSEAGKPNSPTPTEPTPQLQPENSPTPPSDPPSYTSVLFTPALMPSDEQTAKPKRKREKSPEEIELGKKVHRLTLVYSDRVQLCNVPAIKAIVKKAVKAGYTDEQITRGLESVAEDGRPVTTDTLRIAMDGMTPFTRSKGERAVDEYERMLNHFSALDAAEMKAVEA